MKKKMLIISTVVGVLMVSLGIFFNAGKLSSNQQCSEKGLEVIKGGSLYDCEEPVGAIVHRSVKVCVRSGQNSETLHCERGCTVSAENCVKSGGSVMTYELTEQQSISQRSTESGTEFCVIDGQDGAVICREGDSRCRRACDIKGGRLVTLQELLD